jgi:hypothetical protein
MGASRKHFSRLAAEVSFLGIDTEPARTWAVDEELVNLLYPLVIQHSYSTWPIEIVDLPFNNYNFPWQTVSYQRVNVS